MTAISSKSAFAYLPVLTGLIVPAAAAAMPADCSKAAVPAGPLEAEIEGKAFVPDHVRLGTSGTMSQNEVVFDTYRITFKKPIGEIEDIAADVTFLVPKGKLPDGHTYREVPGSISAQPMAADGLPEVQGWSFDDDATGAHVTSVFTDKSSLQLSFAKRAGAKIAGTVYLCALSDKPSWLAGHFTAALK